MQYSGSNSKGEGTYCSGEFISSRILCMFERALLCSTVAGDFDRGDFLNGLFPHLNAEQQYCNNSIN